MRAVALSVDLEAGWTPSSGDGLAGAGGLYRRRAPETTTTGVIPSYPRMKFVHHFPDREQLEAAWMRRTLGGSEEHPGGLSLHSPLDREDWNLPGHAAEITYPPGQYVSRNRLPAAIRCSARRIPAQPDLSRCDDGSRSLNK